MAIPPKTKLLGIFAMYVMKIFNIIMIPFIIYGFIYGADLQLKEDKEVGINPELIKINVTKLTEESITKEFNLTSQKIEKKEIKSQLTKEERNRLIKSLSSFYSYDFSKYYIEEPKETNVETKVEDGKLNINIGNDTQMTITFEKETKKPEIGLLFKITQSAENYQLKPKKIMPSWLILILIVSLANFIFFLLRYITNKVRVPPKIKKKGL